MRNPALASVLHDLRRLAANGDDARQTDRQLLERFLRQREEAAFAVLVRRHGGLVLSACRRVLSDEADIEDAFQPTFLVLLRKAKTVRWQASIGNWLFGVAHRVAVRARVNNLRQRRRETEAASHRPEESPSGAMSWREGVGLLHEELDRLPDTYRLPLLLCCLEGQTRDEAAQTLGCSVGALRGRLERGREMLRRRLLRRGLTLSGALLAALVDTPSTTSAAPAPLVQATLQAAMSGHFDRSIAALMQGATSGLFGGKLRLAVGVLLAIGLLAVGGQAFAPPEVAVSAGDEAKTAKSQAAAKPQAATVAIRGRVLDPDGKPVANAKLYLPQRPKERPQDERDVTISQRGATDAEGRFRLELSRKELETQPGRPLSLLAVANGFGLAWVELTAETRGDLTLRLVKDVPIRGRILTTEGKPVSGVNVAVIGVMAFERLDDFLRAYQREDRHADEGTGARRLNLPLNSVLRINPTDKEGRFEIGGVGIERLAGLEVKSDAVALNRLLVVTRADFDAKAFLKGAIRPAGEQVPLFGPSFEHVVERAVAAQTPAIEGVVREAGSGKPLAGVTVTAAGANAVTDARGHYRLTGMRKVQEYTLQVTAPKDVPLVGRWLRVPAPSNAAAARADAELTRGVVVNGRVYDKATGKGIRDCSVHFSPLPENQTKKTEGLALYGMTGDDGRYRLVTIPGPGVLLAQIPGTILKIDGVPIYPYKAAEFDAADRPRVKLSDEFKPYRGFVTASGVEMLDHNNACKVLDVKDGHAPVSCDLALDPGKTLTVNLQDAEGKPLTGAEVAGISAQSLRAVPLRTATGRIYALDPDKPRPVVFVHAARKLAAVVTLRGDEKEPVTVRLAPTAILTGRALDADGQPVIGAEIYERYATPAGRQLTKSQVRWFRPRTDKEGRFRLDGIVPGLAMELAFVKGRQMLIPQERREVTPPESGKTLDTGEIRVKPRK
jgi:RNA polymerase sigma factor (sigma-70 family)